MTRQSLAARVARLESRRGGFDAWFAANLNFVIGGDGDPDVNVVHPDRIVITLGGNVDPAVTAAQAAVNGRLIDAMRRDWRAGRLGCQP